MNDKIPITFSSATTSSAVKPGGEYLWQMMQLVDKFNGAEREACEQCMLALMKYHGNDPTTYIMFVDTDDVPVYWRQHLPEFVRMSQLVTRGRAVFVRRDAFNQILGL